MSLVKIRIVIGVIRRAQNLDGAVSQPGVAARSNAPGGRERDRESAIHQRATWMVTSAASVTDRARTTSTRTPSSRDGQMFRESGAVQDSGQHLDWPDLLHDNNPLQHVHPTGERDVARPGGGELNHDGLIQWERTFDVQ